MSLLHEIQASLLDEDINLGPILLKLRFLAHRLGSDTLEDWVRFETEGYPEKDAVPEYRRASITYTGTFTNGYRTLNDISIPSALIKKYASENWTTFGIDDPLPMIEAMIRNSEKNQVFGVDASNLKLLLEGKIYEDYSILELVSRIDPGAFVRIATVVRAKLLDLALELEKKVPVSILIEVGASTDVKATDMQAVSSITQNVFYGSVQNISTFGAESSVNFSVGAGDTGGLVKALNRLGLMEVDAKELAEIAEKEKPSDNKSKFGAKAKAWIGERLSKGADGLMKIGGKVLEDDIAKLFQQYYDKIGS